MNIRDITKHIKWKEGASDATKDRTIQRIQAMANAIEIQFPEVRYCNQIKLKHMKYVREAWCQQQRSLTAFYQFRLSGFHQFSVSGF